MKLTSTLKIMLIFIAVTFLCSCSNINKSPTQNTDIKSMHILDNPSVLNFIPPAPLKADGFRNFTNASINNGIIYLKVPDECKVKLNSIETYYPEAILPDSTNPSLESFEKLYMKILENLSINTADTNLKIQADSKRMCAYSISNPTQYYCIYKLEMSDSKFIDYLIFLDISVEGSDSVSPDILQDRMLKTLTFSGAGSSIRKVFVEMSDNSERCRILETYSVEYQSSLIGQYAKSYCIMRIPSMFVPKTPDSSTEYSYGQLNDRLTLTIIADSKKLGNLENIGVTDSGMSYTYKTEDYLSASNVEIVKITARIQVSESQSLNITMELYKTDFDNLNDIGNLNIVELLNNIEYHQP